MDNSTIESFSPNSSHQQHEIYKTLSGHNVARKRSHSLTSRKSNTSELSKIISGIREDNNEPYNDITTAEHLLVHELTHRTEIAPSDVNLEKLETESDVNELNVPNPDEGFAWVIAIISMLAIFASWGSNAAYGVFLNYYINSNTFPGADMYDFALIGGIVVFLAQSTAPITTLLYQVFGLRICVVAGVIIQTAGYILASFATQLWQLYLTQGLMVGLSFSLVYLPATLVLPTWFDKLRTFAFGIAVSGAGLGGIVLALSVNHVISISGSQHWGLRLTALIALISAAPSLFLRPRVQKPHHLKDTVNWAFINKNLKIIFDPKVLQSWPLRGLALWFGLALLGYVVMLFSISSYATSVGLSNKQASNLTALMNAGQVMGRPLMGLVSDRFGRTNTASVLALLIAIMLFAFWINATTYASLIPFSIMIGCIVGIGSTLCQPIASDLILTPSQLPSAWSILNIVVGMFCLVAEVIGLSLKTSGTRPFLHCQIFAGCCFVACMILSMLIRQVLVLKFLTQHLNATKEKIDEINQPKRYLKVEDLNEETLELLQNRLQRYETLVQPGIKFYIIRLFYPIKV